MGKSRRLGLQAILESALGSGNVYFQPPNDTKMQYPCIVYERDSDSVKHADNEPYNLVQRYQVTLIDNNPDSTVVDKLRALPLSAFNRRFSTSGLNHDVFVIYH